MLELLRQIFIGTCYLAGALLMLFTALILFAAIVNIWRNK